MGLLPLPGASFIWNTTGTHHAANHTTTTDRHRTLSAVARSAIGRLVDAVGGLAMTDSSGKGGCVVVKNSMELLRHNVRAFHNVTGWICVCVCLSACLPPSLSICVYVLVHAVCQVQAGHWTKNCPRERPPPLLHRQKRLFF